MKQPSTDIRGFALNVLELTGPGATGEIMRARKAAPPRSASWPRDYEPAG